MKTKEQLEKQIAKLELKYQASATRNVYRIGDKLRDLYSQLRTQYGNNLNSK